MVIKKFQPDLPLQKQHRIFSDPLDEALRTRFICSINNEAVLKALFKINTDELTFTRAIEVVTETEDAAKVAKETVFRSIPKRVQKVKFFANSHKRVATSSFTEEDQGKCYRCGKAGHLAPDCYLKKRSFEICLTEFRFVMLLLLQIIFVEFLYKFL